MTEPKDRLERLFDQEPIHRTTLIRDPAPSRRTGWSAARKPPESSGSVQHGKRRDIQGLRAVAVVAVVVNHLTGHPKGGFVGVDVFFVISGFLITGILVRDAGGGMGPLAYVGNFYRRRVRRILPAGLITIGLTLLVTHQLFSASRFDTTLTDGKWSALFWANWHFVDVSTNYFNLNGPESPFQHYWSLAVEEQFYIVWPLLLLVVVLLAGQRRSPAARRLCVGAVAGMVAVASFVYALHQSATEPTAAYFSTFSRGWELGLGAVLACLLPSLRMPLPLVTALSWLGTALIGVSLFVVDGTQHFPAPAALLPCLGSVLVLAAASGEAVAANPLLTNRVSEFLGDISYSVYLVHLPVIVIAESEFDAKNAYFYATCVLLTLGLSVALYAAVERPVLRSGVLLPRGRGRTDSDDGLPTSLLLFGGIGVLVAALTVYAVTPSTPPVSGLAGNTGTVTGSTPQQAELTAELTAALNATSYPALSPTIDLVVAGTQAAQHFVDCAAVDIDPANACVFGPATAKHTAYLVGDSISMAYAQTLADVVPAGSGWRLKFAGAWGCRFSSVAYQTPTKSVQDACPAHVAAVAADIEKDRPDVLIVANSAAYETVAGAKVTAAQFVADQQAELAQVRPYVGRLVLLDQPPIHAGYPACYRPGGGPGACVAVEGADWSAQKAAYQQLAGQVGAIFVDSTAWFCVDGRCPVFAGTVPTMFDPVHPSQAYAKRLVPVVQEALLALGVLTPPAAVEPTPQLAQQLQAALSATTFGGLGDGEVGQAAVTREIWSRCRSELDVARGCTYGTGARPALVVGDSVAMSWVPSLGAALGSNGYTVYDYARGQCPAVDAELNPRALADPSSATTCRSHNQRIGDVLAELNPSVVIVSATDAAASWLAGDATVAHYQAALSAQLRVMRAQGRTVVVLSAPPISGALEVCRTPKSSPASCVTTVSARWIAMAAADAAAARQAGALYLDVSTLFCVDSRCPAFVGTTPLTYDGTHMTVGYGRLIAASLRYALVRAGAV